MHTSTFRDPKCDANDPADECILCSTNPERRKLVSDGDLVKWVVSKHAYANRAALVAAYIKSECEAPVKKAKRSK